ncbi:helix-turn-helix domain-containing protein [Flavihumibacter sp. UBA7668]|uniref:helix-turn-helix domain-containing protein n=1 Tax=Flavihumibacter sp. UBA7668 TaxID=1946542 RepID=UPI0025B7EAA3|nr:AraC family transcriptional regulator [Flavihumibacter sp. UBA7668]
MPQLIDTKLSCKLEISNTLPAGFPGCRITEHPICTYWFPQGYLTMQEIQSDNFIFSYNILYTQRPFPYNSQLDPAYEAILFCLNGSTSLTLTNGLEYAIAANQWIKVSSAKGISLNNGTEPFVELVFLQFKGDLLNEMQELFPLLNNHIPNEFFDKTHFTPLDSREYIQQILNCKYESELRKHFIDNRVEDIVFNILVSVNGENPIKEINQEDYEKIMLAERLLSEDLIKQRTLKSLAEEIGMGLTKFKQLFKQVYTFTPPDYQKKIRLAKAISYLTEGYSVKESAYKSGWRPAVFIEAFKEVYNTTPGKYIRENRHRSK